MNKALGKLRLRTIGRRCAALLTAAAILVTPAGTPVRSQGLPKGLPIIRDAEIEQLLRDYLTPLLKAAGLGQQNIQVVIINERAFNAFVIDGRRIFVNAGALWDAETPNEIIGVLAHETGHIAGGHLTKLRQELASAQTMAIVAMLLGLGAVAGGAATGMRGGNVGAIGQAAMSAPQEMIRRSLLSYQRAQEEAADRAGVRFLTATNQSPKGMHDTFARMADQTLFAVRNVDPYIQSHPLPKERVAALAEFARTSPLWNAKDPPELQHRHDMMRAKLRGFIERPDVIARRYPFSDTSMPARYARAISTYRFGEIKGAVSQVDALIHAQPNNPYFHELKGQILLESGRAAESVGPLRRASQLAPGSSLMRIMLGQALIQTNDPKVTDEAIAILSTTLAREREVPDGYRQLAIAYGRKNNYPAADLASAQAAFYGGDIKTARELALRARDRFPTGSPGWVSADDIVSFKPPRNQRN